MTAILWYVLIVLVVLWVRERVDSVPRWFDRRSWPARKRSRPREYWGMAQ